MRQVVQIQVDLAGSGPLDPVEIGGRREVAVHAVASYPNNRAPPRADHMQTTNGRLVRALLREHGVGGFTAITQTYGKTFRHSGMVATCEPGIVRALLMDRVHAERRPQVHRLMAGMPGADGVLF